ncbi:MAG: response regulator [Methyloceanibacter sp.]
MPGTDRKLVTIVDDTPTNVAVVSGVLKDAFRTKVATNGDKALGIATGAEKPDLILLDVMMPGMDGFEVCQKLKANPATAEIPIIFLTAKTDSIDEEKGFAMGAVDYILGIIAARSRLAAEVGCQPRVARGPSNRRFGRSEDGRAHPKPH